MIVFLIIVYDLILLSGTAYLVQECNWSMWTFLLTACFFMTTKSSDEKEPT
jgi:hypothetical protein